MRETEIGYLRRGDAFCFKGQKYKILGIGNKSIDNVECVNLETKKRVWLDLATDVEVEE